MRRRAAALALLLTGVAGASCRRPLGPARPPSAVTFAHATPVLSLDPTLSEGTTSSALSNVFEPLVAYDALLQITPVLATRWETPDETTWDFEIRPGVTFHDGTPLDAAVVATALERARRRSDSTVRGALWAVTRVEVRGPLALRIRTSVPDALLLHELTLVLVGRGATRSEADAHPAGTGPYRVASWSRGGPLELAAFPGHWAGPPLLPSVRIVSLPPGTDAVDAVARGEADVAEIPTTPTRASPPSGVRVVTSPGLTTHYLWMNGPATVEGMPNPFHDVRVRRAVALAVDRRLVAREATGSAENAATQLVPPTIVGHSASRPEPPHDPAAARALLAATGARLPLAVTLAHRSDPQGERVARLVAAMLDGAGFQVTLRPMPWDDLLVGSREGRVAFFLGGWAFDAADAAGFLRDCVRSRTEPGGGGVFNPGYANPEVDRIVDASPSVFIASTRVAMLAEAIRIATEDAPLVPLYNQPDAWAVSPRVLFRPRIDGRLLARELGLPELRR